MTQLSIVIISSRDPLHQVVAAVQHAVQAASGFSYQLHLFFNGDEQRALELTEQLKQKFNDVHLHIWYLPLADKANCLNLYWHEIKPDAELHFFLDGYVRVNQNAFEVIISAHRAKPALAYSGIPTNGNSAGRIRNAMLSEGGIHGNLLVLPTSSIDHIQQVNFRLPIGIYRTDSTLGACIAFGFYPQNQKWNSQNIRIVPEANWSFQQLKWYRLRDLKTQLMRKKRQALGSIENRAVRQIFAIEGQPASALPLISSDLCVDYLQKYPLRLTDFLKKPSLYFAIKDLNATHSNKEQTLKLSSLYRKLL